MVDHYKALGVGANATASDIRAAWKAKALELHPDRRKGAERLYTAAREAYDVLADPAARAAYDARRARGLVGVDLRGTIDLSFAVAVAGARIRVDLMFEGHGPRSVVLDVAAGAEPGQQWRFPGRGGAGTPPGALVVEVRHVLADDRWTVDGLDLHTTRRVSLADLYEGSEVVVQAPTGPLAVRLPRGQLRPLRVAGQGLRRGQHVGDLVVALDVVFPPPDPRLRAELRRLSAPV